MRLSEHFSLAEFTTSQTAARLGIPNRPTQQHINNMVELCENVLDPARSKLGQLIVSSGYRSADLNKAIGGSRTSQHCFGEAADIITPRMNLLEAAQWIATSGLPFDQLIYEFDSWIHVSHSGKHNRGEVLTAYKDSDGHTQYARGLV